MKRVLEFHIAASLLLALLLFALRSQEAAIAFIFGSSVSFFNLVALTVVWPRILAKKLVALSIGIIVIKFAILGWILYAVVTGKLFQLGWFAVGMGLVVPSVVATSIKVSQNSLSKADA